MKAEPYTPEMLNHILILCLRLLTLEQRIELIENLSVRSLGSVLEDFHTKFGTEPKE